MTCVLILNLPRTNCINNSNAREFYTMGIIPKCPGRLWKPNEIVRVNVFCKFGTLSPTGESVSRFTHDAFPGKMTGMGLASSLAPRRVLWRGLVCPSKRPGDMNAPTVVSHG